MSRHVESDQPLYAVFGREKPQGALSHIGEVQAANVKLALARARMMYSERPWVEMCIAPASAFSVVVGAHPERLAFA